MMSTSVENSEQRKRKRQSDPIYALVHRSRYRADGILHLKYHRELPQMNISMENNVMDPTEVSTPVLRTSYCVPDLARRNLVRSIRLQYLRDTLSLEEFKSVSTHVVRCHRVGYVKTGGVHGNLSLNNVLFTRDDGSVSKGCLVDWDLVKPIFTDKTTTTPAAGHCAGEPSFMAIELLREEPSLHLYRLDLDSFLYILIWCAVHLNLDGTEEPCINKALQHWTHDTWDSIRRAKGALFSTDSAKYRLSILRGITLAFLPMQKWIAGLIRIFDAGHQARKRHDDCLAFMQWGEERGDTEVWDEESAGGHVTYEAFMAAVGESPQLDI